MRLQEPILHLASNDRVVLNDRHLCCVVRQGSLAIFAVRNAEEAGTRRFLWDIKAGEMLVWTGTRIESPYEIVAIALEESDLMHVSAANEDASLIRSWTERIEGALLKASPEISAKVAASENTEIMGRLAVLEAALCDSLPELDAVEEEKERAQLAERFRQDSRVLSGSVADLSSVLNPKKDIRRDHQSLLADVFCAVARAAHIGIAADVVDARECGTVEELGEAFGIRVRKVKLAGDWWTEDIGPLVAFDESSGLARAVVPSARGVFGVRYHLFDPATGMRLAFTRTLAQKLAPIAYSLYRPMPEPPRLSNIARFAASGLARDIAVVVCCGIGTVLLGMTVPQATAVLVESAIPEGNRDLVFTIAFALAGAAAGTLLFGLAQSVTLLRLETKWGTTLQSAVWDRLLRLSPSFFRRFTAGDLQSRANAITAIRSQISGTTLSSLFAGVASLLNLALMFYFSPVLALFGLAVTAIALLVYLSWARFITRATPRLEELEGRLFGAGVQLIDAVPKLRIAGAEGRAFAYWSRIYAQKQKLRYEVSRVEDRVTVFNGILPVLTLALAFGIVANINASSDATRVLGLGSFLAFNAAFGAFLAGTTALTSNGVRLVNIRALWKRVEPILDEVPEVRSGSNQSIRLSGRIKMDHVTFRYRNDGPLTLENVSLEVEPGSCIALVGPSGSGKTTIVSLLLGFERPLSGGIYFDGYDLANLDVRTVRRQIGVVLQHNSVMTGSIFENIVSGTSCTVGEAWDAARAAAFEHDINQFPMRMHTVVSEGGRNLSGGQRQRLALARALVLKPRILILDEATSALDNTTQAAVMENLNRMRVTRIIVAHRLSTIRQADKICVIDAGRVVQAGKFEDLAATDGLFRKLIQRQTI